MAEGQDVTEAGLDVLRGFGLPETMANGKPAKKPDSTKEGKEAIDRAVVEATGFELPRTSAGPRRRARRRWPDSSSGPGPTTTIEPS